MRLARLGSSVDDAVMVCRLSQLLWPIYGESKLESKNPEQARIIIGPDDGILYIPFGHTRGVGHNWLGEQEWLVMAQNDPL